MKRDQDQRDFARLPRNEPTAPEKLLWQFLRGSKLGAKFRRKAAIAAYLVDFVCFARQLIVELDGPQHLDPAAKAYDAQRTASLESSGFRVIRFLNQTLDENLREVVEEIRRALASLRIAPLPNSPREGR